MTPDATIRRARTAFWWVGVIAPLALLVLAAAVVLAWFPELPDPVATHWGLGGADGFGPRWMILSPLLIGAAMTVLFAVIGLFGHRMPTSSVRDAGGIVMDAEGAPRWSTSARLLGAVSLGEAGFMAFLTLVIAAVQRGLADAADAPDVTGWILVGFALLAAFAVGGWFAQPRVRTVVRPAADPEPTVLAPSERAAWFGSVSIARGGAVMLGTLWMLLAATAVFVIVGGREVASAWILGVTTVVLLVAIATSLCFRVRISAAGVQVRSLIGRPNTRIALGDITAVQVAQVNPMAEFGGWGWRIAADGRGGVVLRAGEALQITQRNGRVFVVTVNGAGDAAAVLEGLRARNEGATA